MRRFVVGAIVGLAALLAAPAVAQAAGTVTADSQSITFTAGAADVNDLDITQTGDTYLIDEDTVAVDVLDGEAGSLCSQFAFGEVTCTIPGLQTIDVNLGNGSDTLDASTLLASPAGPFGVRAFGGAGGDTITTGAGDFDSLAGGLDADTLTGGAGSGDTVDYSQDGRAAGVTVNLTTGLGGNGDDGAGDTLAGIENVVGTEFDDTLVGNGQPNEFQPGFGEDDVDGEGNGVGQDLISYNSRSTDLTVDLGPGQTTGNGDSEVTDEDGPAGDTLEDLEGVFGGSGDDTLSGNDADNFFFGAEGNDEIDALGGADAIFAFTGTDDIDAGGGDDGSEMVPVAGQGGDDFIEGGGGNDVLDGDDDTVVDVAGENEDVISGSAGDDVIIGGVGDDNETVNTVHGLSGGTGNDSIEGGSGEDFMSGGGDTDELEYDGSPSAVDVNLTTLFVGGGDAEDDEIDFTFEDIQGSDFDDGLTGSSDPNEINGLDGPDSLAGLAGNDTLDGGDGDDIAIYLSEPGTTADLSAGNPTATNTSGTDDLDSIENLYGSPGIDDFTGDGNANFFNGLGSNDKLTGNGGGDDLNGGSGDDLLLPGPGNDDADGEGDNDTVSYADSPGTRVLMNVSDATASGIPADSAIEQDVGTIDDIPNVENAIGSPNLVVDFFVGDSGPNRYEGPAGDDTVFAGPGDDTLIGTNGSDLLQGEAGNDFMTGGPGGQTFDGGGDIDTVSYAGAPGDIDAFMNSNVSDDGEASPSNDFLSGGIENLIATPNDGDLVFGTTGPNTIDLGAGNNDFALPDDGNDVVDGGPGMTDGVSFQNQGAGGGVTASLSAGTATGAGHGNDTLTGLERMNGSNNADTLTGDGGPNSLSSLDGNDTLIGRGGVDDLHGGNDIDTASYATASGPVTAQLGPSATNGSASFDGDGASDTLNFIETLTGSENADTLTGNGDSRTINGLGGNDLLQLRNAGPDIADCGAGTDRANTDATDTNITNCEKADGPGPTATPSITSSIPGSGGDNNAPLIKGTAPADATVTLYGAADCSGTPLASGSAADFAGAGLPISVADNSTTSVFAKAADGDLDGDSACSAGFTYTEATPPPDTTAPVSKIAKPIKKTKDTTPTFKFSSEAGVTFECRIDKAAFKACKSPYTAKKLKPGKHTFSVRAIDAAGNVGAAVDNKFKVKKKKKK